jgi:hypothetical protein
MSRAVDRFIWRDDWFGNLNHVQRLMWIGLVTSCADDQGRLANNPRLIVADLFPFDEQVNDELVRTIIENFIAAGKVYAYQVDSKKLLQIVNWWKYQSSAAWMACSKLPAPENWIDRFRYHGAQKKIIESNWDKSGGFTNLPSTLLSALGRTGVEDEDEVNGDDEVNGEGEGETNPPPKNQQPASTINPSANPEKTELTEPAAIREMSEEINLNNECGYTQFTLQQIAAAWEKYLEECKFADSISYTLREWIATTSPISVDNLPESIKITVHAESADAAKVLQKKIAPQAQRVIPRWLGRSAPDCEILFVNGAKGTA